MGKITDEMVIQKRAAAYTRHASAFWKTFKMPLRRYYPSHVCGLDVFKFEEEIARPAKGQTLAQAVRAKFGDAALAMVDALL